MLSSARVTTVNDPTVVDLHPRPELIGEPHAIGTQQVLGIGHFVRRRVVVADDS